MSPTFDTDVQFTEVHRISSGKLHDGVSGRRLVGVIASQAHSSTYWHGARILTTHGVVVQSRRLYLCRYVRQTDDEIVRTPICSKRNNNNLLVLLI